MFPRCVSVSIMIILPLLCRTLCRNDWQFFQGPSSSDILCADQTLSSLLCLNDALHLQSALCDVRAGVGHPEKHIKTITVVKSFIIKSFS